nr:multidrug efflux SMR transporter [Haloglycomyces albus]
MLAWVVLAISGAFETVWAIALDRAEGFTRLWPSIVFLVALAISMSGLGWAMKEIPVGTAYAVWVGIGASLTALYGMIVLDEPATIARVVCLVLIIAGVAGLKFLHLLLHRTVAGSGQDLPSNTPASGGCGLILLLHNTNGRIRPRGVLRVAGRICTINLGE